MLLLTVLMCWAEQLVSLTRQQTWIPFSIGLHDDDDCDDGSDNEGDGE